MKKKYFLSAACILLLILGCKKTKIDNETASSTDFSLASQEFFQVLIHINEHAVAEKGLNNITSTSYTTSCLLDSLRGDTTHDTLGTFTNTANLPTMKLQYNNCTGADGKARTGVVQVSFTKKYDVIGSVATAMLINYSVSGFNFTGTLTITRNSATSFAYTVKDGVCTSGSTVVKYSAGLTVTLFDNGTPSMSSDDYVQATGTVNGVTRENRLYAAAIGDALKKRSDCAWIGQGTVSISPDQLDTRKLDFGKDVCDDVATFTVDEQTYTVHLSK
jgi:hypothetical protein